MVIFFDDSERDTIIAKIREAESKTSGEIRVHVDKARIKDPVKHAARVFDKMGMANTRERNGVLIYVNSSKREFAIIGDKGIHEKVGEGFWKRAAGDMSGAFRESRYLDGVVAAIDAIGEKLRRHFPGKEEEVKEMRDDISYK